MWLLFTWETPSKGDERLLFTGGISRLVLDLDPNPDEEINDIWIKIQTQPDRKYHIRMRVQTGSGYISSKIWIPTSNIYIPIRKVNIVKRRCANYSEKDE